MKLDEYLVSNCHPVQQDIIAGMQAACDRAWELYQQDPDNSYVYVEDTFGHTVLEYGDIELPDRSSTFEHLGYNKPNDIIDDCLMSYKSTEVV